MFFHKKYFDPRNFYRDGCIVLLLPLTLFCFGLAIVIVF